MIIGIAINLPDKTERRRIPVPRVKKTPE